MHEKQNDDSAKKIPPPKKKNCKSRLRRVVLFFWNTGSTPKEERGKIQVCSTATNLVSSGHVKRPQSTWRGRKTCQGRGVASIRSSPRRCVGECFYREIHGRERNTSCARLANARQSTAGRWHANGVERRSRVDGRCLPGQLRVRVRCRSLSCVPLVTEHTQFRVAGIGITFFRHATKMGQEQAVATTWNARTSSWLVVLTHARETSFAYLARTSLRGKYFSGVLGFLSFLFRKILYLCFWYFFVIDRPMFVCFVVCVFLCARITVLVFVFASVILGGGPARRVNPGDATPIARPRPARKGNKQTQTDNFFAWPHRAHRWAEPDTVLLIYKK